MSTFASHAGKGIGSFHFRQGDVIILPEEENNDEATPDEWATGICERSGSKGRFPMDCVYVLPCLDRPPDAFLVCILQILLNHLFKDGTFCKN